MAISVIKKHRIQNNKRISSTRRWATTI